jgi:hypothetical protein
VKEDRMHLSKNSPSGTRRVESGPLGRG